MKDRILLIDGHSIINRAFYGVPGLTNTQGFHTNGIYGFFNIMLKTMDDLKPDYMAVAFDLKAPTFRHKMFDAYKGTRKPMPEELREQVPVLKELLAACGIPVVTMEGYEADDILGTLAKESCRKGMEVMILSGDRDLLQLAEKHIGICIPKTKSGGTVTETYYEDTVKEVYGVTPEEFIDLKALMGDPSDNIPGVPGIGEKTAGNLIRQYHSVENLYQNLEEVKPPKAKKSLEENRDKAELSYTLAKICLSVPLEFAYEQAGCSHIFTREAYDMMSRLELRSLLKRFSPQEWEKEPAVEQEWPVFKTIGGIEEIEAYFSGITAEEIGISGDEKGIYLYQEGKEGVYMPAEGFVTASYLTDKLNVLKEKTTLVLQDVKAFLKNYPLSGEKGCFDASVAAYLINPLQSSYGTEELAAAYLELSVYPKEQSSEAVIACRCRTKQIEQLREKGMEELYETIEMPLIFSLDRMEKAGIAVRREELKDYGERLTDGIEELKIKIYEQAGHEFNILSPKQLGTILFEEMQLPHGKKTKTGYSTSADVLEKLRGDYPIVDQILEYRTLTKLKSTYADGLAVFIGEDGRIHGHFNQTITATGRISSTDPNLQNIPARLELGREIRKVFVPREGCIFMDADYSQIELRLLAHMSGDSNLIEAYRESRDIHASTASQVFHVPLEEVTPQLRRNAKAVNFGVVYGISAFGLSEDLSISRQEAGDYIKQYFETYPGVKAYLDEQVAFCKEHGYVTTLYGRRRPVPEIKASNFMQRSFGERVAMNSPIQGTAADIMKIAMIGVDRALKEAHLQARIVLQVHDELLIELPENEKEAVAGILNDKMRDAAALSVPLEISVSTGNNWYETK